MTELAIIAAVSIFTAGLTVSFGAIGPALGEGRAAATASMRLRSNPMPQQQFHAPCSSVWP